MHDFAQWCCLKLLHLKMGSQVYFELDKVNPKEQILKTFK